MKFSTAEMVALQALSNQKSAIDQQIQTILKEAGIEDGRPFNVEPDGTVTYQTVESPAVMPENLETEEQLTNG